MDNLDSLIAAKVEGNLKTFQSYDNDPDLLKYEPATEADLAAAEARLSVNLPPSYRKFCMASACYVWDDVVWPAEIGESGQFSFLLTISEPGDGDEYCFDTRSPDADGEYPIVSTNHETDDEDTTQFRPVAPHFLAFLQGPPNPDLTWRESLNESEWNPDDEGDDT